MNQEYNWNGEKKDLKKLDTNMLQEKLQELETEKMKLETDMYRNNGSSLLIRNYPFNKQSKPYGNIKKIKKTIAFIKTILHIKLQQNNQSKK